MLPSNGSGDGWAGLSTGHAFVSYVHEDASHVDRLQQFLEDAGITVWRDTARLWPGQDWRAQIRNAITADALAFLACFSRVSVARAQSYQNEELAEAIDQLRLRPHDVTWLIPVRFDDCLIPDRDIGGGRTLRYLHYIDLFGDRYQENAGRLAHAVRGILGRAAGNDDRPLAAGRSGQAPEISVAGAGEREDASDGYPAGSTVLQAAGNLAGHVSRECTGELNDRVLQGWNPLPVDWQPGSGQHADPGMGSAVPPGNAAAIGPLARHVRSGRRLVVLGPGGSGKSTLATLLVAELLAARQPEDPVPVLVPAASLQPGERVKSWLERVLSDRYPSLRDIGVYGPGAISRLVSEHHLLPVIDSLDELDPYRRAQLLIALNRAFGRSQPAILTCRTREYHEAVEASGVVMPGAAVIELQPVTAENAARYLRCGTAGSRRSDLDSIAAAMRSDPAGPIAVALASPLMIALVRAASGGPAPLAGSLSSQIDPAAVEGQILQSLIETTFSMRATSEHARSEQRWKTPDAERWLGFLASHLTSLRTYDLDWPQLRYALHALRNPAGRAALGAALCGLIAGTIFGASRGLAYGLGQGVFSGLTHGLDVTFVIAATYLSAPLAYPPGCRQPQWLHQLRRLTGTPSRAALMIPAAYALESGLRDGIGAAWFHGAGAGILLGLTALALNWAFAAIVVWLAIWAGIFNLAEKPAYFRLNIPGRRAEFTRALATGAALGLAVGYGVKILSSVLAAGHLLWGLGMPAGGAIGAAFSLIQWGRTPAASAQSSSPASTLRADRNLLLWLAVPFLVIIPVCFGAAFAADHHNQLHEFLEFGLYGLGIGLTIWLAIALSRAWPQYLITIAWLASQGKLPWRLSAFLAETHRLQILRLRGGAYQFRHARLQDHLALMRLPAVPSGRAVGFRAVADRRRATVSHDNTARTSNADGTPHHPDRPRRSTD